MALGDININKVILSEEFPCSNRSSKYFVGCKNNEKVRLLQVLLSKISNYVKNFDDDKTILFIYLFIYLLFFGGGALKDEKLLKKHDEI